MSGISRSISSRLDRSSVSNSASPIQSPAAPQTPRPSRLALVRDITVNAIAPYVTFLLLRANGVDIVPALAAGAIFPAGATIFALVRDRRIDAYGGITQRLLD